MTWVFKRSITMMLAAFTLSAPSCAPRKPESSRKAAESSLLSFMVSALDTGQSTLTVNSPTDTDLSNETDVMWPPDGYSILAESQTPILLFSSARGVILITFRFEPKRGFYAYLDVHKVSHGVCMPLGNSAELPPIGTVDLNLDPKQRWGFRQGAVQDKTGLANRGFRTVVGAGFFLSRMPWIAMTTYPGNAKRNVLVTDLFLLNEDQWKTNWTTYFTQWTWLLADSRVDADGIVALEAPNINRPMKQDYVPRTVGLWTPNARFQRFPLAKIPIETAMRDPGEIGSFDDGSIVIVGNDSTFSLTIERFSLEDHRSIFKPFPEIKLPWKNGMEEIYANGRKTQWDVYFDSANSFLLWRVNEPMLRFEFDPASQSYKYATTDIPAPRDVVLAALPLELHPGLYGVFQLPDGEILAVVQRDADWFVLSNRPTVSPCTFDKI